MQLLIAKPLGGYICLTQPSFKYNYQRSARHILMLHSAIAGVFLIPLSIATHLILQRIFNCDDYINTHLSTKIEYIEIAVLSFSLPVIHMIYNKLYKKIFKKRYYLKDFKYIRMSIERKGNRLDKLLFNAINETKLIQITLDNSKVYIGWVYDIPKPMPTPYLSINPLASGYRNSQHKFELTTDYINIIEDTNNYSESFQKVLKLDNIVSISLFEPQIYEKYFKSL